MMALVAVIALALFLVLFLSPVYLGVGHTTLRTTFVVLDAENSRPIPYATLEYWEDPPIQSKAVTTNDVGEHIHEALTVTTSRSSWRERTLRARPPQFAITASAPGYETSKMISLDSLIYARAVKSAYPLSTLEVKIELSKSPLDRSKGR